MSLDQLPEPRTAVAAIVTAQPPLSAAQLADVTTCATLLLELPRDPRRLQQFVHFTTGRGMTPPEFTQGATRDTMVAALTGTHADLREFTDWADRYFRLGVAALVADQPFMTRPDGVEPEWRRTAAVGSEPALRATVVPLLNQVARREAIAGATPLKLSVEIARDSLLRVQFADFARKRGMPEPIVSEGVSPATMILQLCGSRRNLQDMVAWADTHFRLGIGARLGDGLTASPGGRRVA